MTRPLRVGVLGCADIAWRKTLPAFAADDGSTVTAIASRDLAKAERFTARFGGTAVAGYAELLERDDVDAVYLPLPGMLHAEWSERALRAGKHVFAEKPLATDREQAESLFRLADEHRLVLLENFMFLHHSQHTRVAELLASGAVGALRSLAATFTIPPKPADDIRFQPAVGGGALHDIGVYPIRTALHYLGPGLDVVGSTLRVERDRGVVLGGSALLSTRDGITAHLRFGMEHSYRTRYELHGSTGCVRLDRAFTPPPAFQPTLRVERQDHREEITLAADDQFANVVRLFVRATTGDADIRRWTQDSLDQAALVEAVRTTAVHVHV